MGNFPNQPESNKEQRKREAIDLARELVENNEIFSFPGIDSEAYSKIKVTEEKYPGYGTPIDELLERFKNEGMKVVLGAHPESGNVFILPAQSNDIENDAILPRQLQMSDSLDEKIKNLISLYKWLYHP